MTLTSAPISPEVLKDHEHAEFILVGDASVTSPVDLTTWACSIITSGIKSELIYGIDNSGMDIQQAELSPYIHALRLIRARFRDGSDYKIRVSVITDSRAIVRESSGIPGFSTTGMWAELNTYANMFDIVWEHRKRRSTNLLEYADNATKVLRRGHIFLKGLLEADPSTRLEGRHVKAAE